MRTVGKEYSTMTGIIRHLQAWRKDKDITKEEPIQDNLEDQLDIESDDSIFGFISQKWTITQQKEDAKRVSKKYGERWVATLVQKLWELAWDQWLYRNADFQQGKQLYRNPDPELLAKTARKVPWDPPSFSSTLATMVCLHPGTPDCSEEQI